MAEKIAGRYGLALALLIIALVYTMAAAEGKWQIIVALALQVLALYVVLQASRADPRLTRLLAAFFLLAFAAALSAILTTDLDESSSFRMAVLAIVLMTLPVVAIGLVRQVKAESKITIQTMMGVLCAYLLMMCAFAYTYAVLGDLNGPFFTQGEEWDRIGNYLYYSLITITTVGMGDLTPATQLGRSLTGAEALIGQIYMVTVVAVIVSNLGRSGPPKDPDQPVGAGKHGK
ncbi:MAG: potassium channel family protein [Solirubrobacterales bacterium]